jgi:hypothetical protein
MTQNENSKKYDLEERTLRFAKGVIRFVGILPKTLANIEIMKQIIRSSGSLRFECTIRMYCRARRTWIFM